MMRGRMEEDRNQTHARCEGKRKKRNIRTNERTGWKNALDHDRTKPDDTWTKHTVEGNQKNENDGHEQSANRVRKNGPMLTKQRESNHAPSNGNDVQDRHDATGKSRTNPIPSPSTAEVCRIRRYASTNPEPREPAWTCSPTPSTW